MLYFPNENDWRVLAPAFWDIRCPECGKKAAYVDRVFHIRKGSIERHRAEAEKCGHPFKIEPDRRADKHVKVTFFPATTVEGECGIVRCPHCALDRPHTVQCMSAFWYQAPIRKLTLYAPSRAYLTMLESYIESQSRKEFRRQHQGWSYWFEKLPAEFVEAKNRELVLKRIREMLLS